MVGKLAIEARCPFYITIDHENESYSVKPFDKPDAPSRKFMAQDVHALPPQILPCDDIDLPDLCYLNQSFKDVFNIESYNSV